MYKFSQVCSLVVAMLFNAVPMVGQPATVPMASVRVFEEPVVCVLTTEGNETAFVNALLSDYQNDYSKAKLDQIVDWAEKHPESGWSPSLLLNSGRALYNSGYFTNALEAWLRGWEMSRHYDNHQARVIADLCLGEYLRMQCRLGESTEVARLLLENQHRKFTGPGGVLVNHAQDALGVMTGLPETAFKCGPMALASVRKVMNLPEAYHETLHEAASTSAGFSLQEVKELAQGLGMQWEAVRIEGTPTSYPFPSVIHWKLGHYAALVGYNNGKYHVKDPTFGSDLYVDLNALQKEASGYFLIPGTALTPSFKTLSLVEASNIRGKGTTFFVNPWGTTFCDFSTGGSSSGGGANELRYAPGSNEPPVPSSGCKGCASSGGGPSMYMPTYKFHPMLANLSIVDTPLGYTPNYGPGVNFTLVYNHMEHEQESMPAYSNVGDRWNFTWFSAVKDNPDAIANSQSNEPQILMAGGGRITFSNWDSSTKTYLNSDYGNAKLKRITDSPVRYELVSQDGSKNVYTLIESQSSTSRKVLMTSTVDAHGHEITYNYTIDGNNKRLTSVTDALGGVTTLCYEANCGTPNGNLIRKVSDPYGRTAVLDYDANGRLNSITDMIGLTSTFDYISGNFINAMNTPYGTTTFQRGQSSDEQGFTGRWIQATDPFGDAERAEYSLRTSLIPKVLDESELPAPGTVSVNNDFMNNRNAFYWNKSAMKSGHCTLENAQQIHFVHDSAPSTTGRLVEVLKQPLESRVFYNYKGSSPAFLGDTNLVSGIARVLDDGSTQYTKIDYNFQGNPISYTDPIGRTTILEYDSSGYHVTSVKQQTSTGNDTIKTVGYTTMGLPDEIIDASGQTYTIAYNTFGQPTAITNPLNETVTFTYSTTGLLQRKTGNDPASYKDYSYDIYDRVTSVTSFPDNYTLRYEYDLGNRLTKVIYPDGTYEQQVYDKLDVVASRDRLGRWTQMNYTLLGQLASVTNPAGETIQYSWCACGSLTRIADANGKITAYTMDVAGRIIKEELPDLSTTTYTYEPRSGRLATKTDPKGQVTNYAYHRDDSIWKTWITNVATGTAAVPPVEYAWDNKFKRMTEWNDGLGTTSLEYVPYNSGDSTWGDGKLLSTSVPWSSDIMTYVYDQLGRMTNKSMGGSVYSISKVYDSYGRVESSTSNLGTTYFDYVPHTSRVSFAGLGNLEHHFSYEGPNKDLALSQIYSYNVLTGEGRSFGFDYDAVGRVKESAEIRHYYDTLEILNKYTYDSADRLISSELSWPWGEVENSYKHWRHDPAGNRLNTQRDSSDSPVYRNKYSVNSADQLVSVHPNTGPIHVSGTLNEQGKISTGLSQAPVLTESDGSFRAWIDTNNQTSVSFAVKDFQGNTTNKTVTVETPELVSGYDFQYDLNGNRTYMEASPFDQDEIETIYEWDARDQLVAINRGDHRSEFTYDGMRRRVRIKEIENNITQSDRFYLWDGLKIIASGPWNSAGIAGADKKYFDEGFIKGSQSYLYIKDRLGSVRALIGATSGYVEGSINYDEFGMPGSELFGAEDDADFLYTGHFYHRPSGLYLAPYRAYDPMFGRWLSREPLRLDGPNLYHYVYNNPLYYIDPLGLSAYDGLDDDKKGSWYDGFKDGFMYCVNGICGAVGKEPFLPRLGLDVLPACYAVMDLDEKVNGEGGAYDNGVNDGDPNDPDQYKPRGAPWRPNKDWQGY